MNRWTWKRSIHRAIRDPESVNPLWSILGLILLIAIVISLIKKIGPMPGSIEPVVNPYPGVK